MSMHTQEIVVRPTTVRKAIKAIVPSKFRIITHEAIDPKTWMAMISLPDGSTQRFRCTNGLVVDERTVGD